MSRLGNPGATKVLGSLSLLVVAALGWTFVVGPETATLAETREQVQTTRDQNAVLATQLAALEKQRQDLGATRRSARRLAAKFPPTADQPGMFEEVTAAAVDAGIGPKGVTTLAPTPPVIGSADGAAAAGSATSGSGTGAPATGNLARQTVSVSVTGTYDQTEALLENLEQMPRAYLITALTLSGGQDGGDYTTTINGEMFVMPPVQDPGKTLNVSGPTRDGDGG